MHLKQSTGCARTALASAALGLSLTLTLGPATAADATYVMKLGLATINDAQHEWCKRFVAMVEKDSGGRIKGQIYPASQLGPIPREIEGVQFGAIQGYIGPPEFLVGVDNRFEIMSAPGLITDMAHGVRVTGDPQLQKLMFGLGANKGIHGVALFVSQPSVDHLRDPIRHLADIKGKKLRVLAADMQQEMIKRLGGSPVAMTLGDVLPAIQQGAIDGAVLALTVDTTMQYYDAAKYITTTGQPFIFSMAFLSKKWFDALPKICRRSSMPTRARPPPRSTRGRPTSTPRRRDSGSSMARSSTCRPTSRRQLMKTVAGVGADVAKGNPEFKAGLRRALSPRRSGRK